MKQMFCNFKPKTFSIDYLKALQIGSVGSDSVCINTLFSIYTYIYIYICIDLYAKIKIYLPNLVLKKLK